MSGIRSFEWREYREALAFSAGGGQALLVHPWHGPSRFQCFNGAPEIGKLLDADTERLTQTAKSLGVNRISICRRGGPGQHVDLVGKPLLRAKMLCMEATCSA